MSPTSLQFSASFFQNTTIPSTTTSTTSTTSIQQQQQQNDPFKAFQQQQQKSTESTKPEVDPYAALRGLVISSPEPPKSLSRQEPDIPNFHERQDSDEMSWTEFSTSTGDADFGDFASPAPPPPPATELKNTNAFGDLDPIAQIKRSSYRV
ncbi:hypothetical protein BDC45DRAFT_502907 [Circinella umbellata]|nr:hypothetical protein BDC45DRAFT_502907 [Circinella umbellata]